MGPALGKSRGSGPTFDSGSKRLTWINAPPRFLIQKNNYTAHDEIASAKPNRPRARSKRAKYIGETCMTCRLGRRQPVILVAEQELLLRFLVAEFLRTAGYDVIEVG